MVTILSGMLDYSPAQSQSQPAGHSVAWTVGYVVGTLVMLALIGYVAARAIRAGWKSTPEQRLANRAKWRDTLLKDRPDPIAAVQHARHNNKGSAA